MIAADEKLYQLSLTKGELTILAGLILLGKDAASGKPLHTSTLHSLWVAVECDHMALSTGIDKVLKAVRQAKDG